MAPAKKHGSRFGVSMAMGDAGPGTRVALLIPCFNAGPRVEPVVRGAASVASQVFVIDDGCTDGCLDGLDIPGVTILRHERNRGKGHALLTGFRAALEQTRAECIATLDADGQHDASDLPALFDAFEHSQADLLIGARSMARQGVPWASRIGNTVTAAVTRALLPGCPRDTQSGYRLHRRHFLERILPEIHPGRYETEMEILVRALRGGFAVREHPIATRYEAGNASSHFRKVQDSWRIYRRLGASLLRGG